MTACQLAERMTEHDLTHPVSTNTIYRWESGKQSVPLDSFVVLLQVLEVSPYYIIGDFSPIDEEDKQLHNAVQHLSRHEKNIITYLITKWAGCVHCLFEAGLLYACMSERLRKLSMRHCIKLCFANRGELDHHFDDVDIDKILDGTARLNKRKGA